MREIQASEAKTKLPALLGDVERGETIIITRHGKAIARLVPEEQDSASKNKQAVEALRKWRQEQQATGLTVDEILSARNEGRR